MGGGGGMGVGEKKVNLMSKISEYHLHIILLLIKYVCCLMVKRTVFIEI